MKKSFIVIIFVFLSGCASMMDGRKQSITIDSDPQGATVLVAGGENGRMIKPEEVGVTPITVEVWRKEAIVLLKKEGFQDTQVPLVRGFNNWVWGDILITSPLSTSIDSSTGAINEYKPGKYMVTLTKE